MRWVWSHFMEPSGPQRAFEAAENDRVLSGGGEREPSGSTPTTMDPQRPF
jgi:hypothetical protein